MNDLTYNQQKQLEELSSQETEINQNDIQTIKKIPAYFNSDDPVKNMILAFMFGKSRGRECERELIKWNALACYHNMITYSKMHSGALPESYQDLITWVCKENKDLIRSGDVWGME